MVPNQLADRLLNEPTKRRMSTAKPAAFGPTERKAVTGVGAA